MLFILALGRFLCKAGDRTIFCGILLRRSPQFQLWEFVELFLFLLFAEECLVHIRIQ